jgi:hypothetical protein
MPDDLVEALANEAASLWLLVDSIERHVAQQTASRTYTGATSFFFTYVRKLAEGTKGALSTESLPLDDIRRARLDIATLRQYWRLLHELIKPASEAHSLTAPEALIELAAEQVRRVSGLQDSKVVVSLSARLMYHQTTNTKLSALGKRIQKIVPKAVFPDQLGFIALPYSQGPSFFANLLLYHELGHFVFEELSVTDAHAGLQSLDVQSTTAIDEAIAGRNFSQGGRAFALTVLRNWTHEIFCDLFALSLVGPAFSFAFVELLSLLDVLEPPVTIAFNTSHPAPACRFRQHIDFVKLTGWWEHVVGLHSLQKSLIERLAAEPEDDYRLSLNANPEKDTVLIPAFLKIVPQIRVIVKDLTEPVLAKPDDFAEHRGHVEKCLFNGIVPSVSINDAEGLVPAFSVINSSFFFYLTSLGVLMESLGENRLNVERRGVWKHRLEAWTQKALEDIQLLGRSKIVSTDGRTF